MQQRSNLRLQLRSPAATFAGCAPRQQFTATAKVRGRTLQPQLRSPMCYVQDTRSFIIVIIIKKEKHSAQHTAHRTKYYMPYGLCALLIAPCVLSIQCECVAYVHCLACCLLSTDYKELCIVHVAPQRFYIVSFAMTQWMDTDVIVRGGGHFGFQAKGGHWI
jgi:hypothetical protein